ncbi:hypothetical protein PPERSA_09233 [Pseudocohnilembus persalinus]|uniref:Kinase domain protein n=1 Tax=Pseudocohnilembus persalinus TaxID=266149 RepID=A0A0V0R530_PSEPJ|nr:hypothetical protein PPERSA_09233 [Pseudocohnilembus persalinus]|eukprot:KRX09349.1 hypothetical protein PPERSA_09233 [Pseudocohnilembus persalinus]
MKFQYFCLKEECLQQKPTKCQLFYCPLCYEDLDENNQLQNHKIYDINILNNKNKNNIFKNKPALGTKLWEMIKQKYGGSLENFENECLEINQRFIEIKQKQLDNIKGVQNHFNIFKQEINQQLDQISKSIKVKLEECANLHAPTDIMKLINQKTSDFQELVGMLAKEPKKSLQFYKNTFQNQLNSLREDTKNLLVSTQFSKQIKEQNQDQDLNIYLSYNGLDSEQNEENYINYRQKIRTDNNQQDQQQEQTQKWSEYEKNNIQVLILQEINYSAEMETQLKEKVREFKNYMNKILQVSQTKTHPLNKILKNNLEINEQVQQLIENQQQIHLQKNNIQQEIDSINTQKKIIQQYTDSIKFLEDFPAVNNQQQYKKLSKSQINAITDLRVQLGYYDDLKNRIESFGYNSLGKQGVKEINEIIFNNLELKNLQNLSLNYHKSNLCIQEYLQMINQLGSWQLTPQISKLSLGYRNNNLDQQKVSQIIQQLFGTQKLENLKELELEFQWNFFSDLEFYSSKLTFKQEINQQLDQISKSIKVKLEECANLHAPTDIMKLINQKTSDFQELVGMLAKEPKKSLQFYKNTFQNQLNSLREDTKNLLVSTQFSKQIKEQNQDQDLNIYLSYNGLDSEQNEENYINYRQKIRTDNNQQDQQQEQTQKWSEYEKNNIQVLILQEINYSAEMETQLKEKVREFKNYMNKILQVSQTKTHPLNKILKNNLEINEQVQQLIENQQQIHLQKNNIQQEIDSINTQKKIIQQYTDSIKFLEDFPAVNNQQQYKKLSKSQINAITDLRVQLGYYDDLKNRIESFGYNSLGKQGVKEINEIIFNNLELKNLQNLSLNYHKSNLCIQEYLQMINQLGSWQLTPQISKLSLGYRNNNLDQQKVSQIIQQLFGTQKLENLKELELEFQWNFFSDLEFYSSKLTVFLKQLQSQQLQIQENVQNHQLEIEIKQEQLKEFNFYLYNLEKLKIDLSFCKINNEKLSKISEQVALLGVCMPKLSFLEIFLRGNKEITNEGINTFSQTLANSSLLKNLRTISLNFSQIENISDDSLIQLSEILVSKGKNLDAVYLYIQRTSVSSLGVKKISEILCKKQLQKLLIDFSFNNQLNGQEIIDVAKTLTQTKVNSLPGSINQTLFHQNLTELCIRFNNNPSELQMLEFFDILTNDKFFPSLSSLQIYAYNNKLNDDNFQTIWNNLTNPQSLTKLKYLYLFLAGSKISPESQVLASLKIAQTSKFQNLEELLLSYENADLNKQVNNRSCAVNIVQNLVNSENLRKLKHLSLDFRNNDLKADGCQQVVEELYKPKNKLSLEEISLNFWDNGIEKNQCQELNRQFRNSLITEQLRVANIFFDFV